MTEYNPDTLRVAAYNGRLRKNDRDELLAHAAAWKASEKQLRTREEIAREQLAIAESGYIHEAARVAALEAEVVAARAEVNHLAGGAAMTPPIDAKAVPDTLEMLANLIVRGVPFQEINVANDLRQCARLVRQQAEREEAFPWFLLKEAAMFVRREADLSGLVDARNMAYRLELALWWGL